MKAFLISAFAPLVLLGGCASMGGPGHGMHGAERQGAHSDCPMMGSGAHEGRDTGPGGPMAGRETADCPMAQHHPDNAQPAPQDHNAPTH